MSYKGIRDIEITIVFTNSYTS